MNVPVVANTQSPQTVAWPSDATSLMVLCRELSKARSLPTWCQQSPADLFFAVQSCLRAGLDPFMALRHISTIRENLFFDGQLCNAILNNSDRLATNVDFKFEGEKDNLTVTVSARLRNESEPRELKVRYGDVKNIKNENWLKNPQQQLGYKAVRDWGRRFCPEVLMGFRFKDEQDEMIDVTPPKPNDEQKLEQLKKWEQSVAESVAQQRSEQPQSTDTAETKSSDEARPFTLTPATEMDSKSWAAWAATFLAYIRAASSADTINDWLNWNSHTLAGLSRFHAVNYKTLTEKVKAEMAKFDAREAT